MKIDYDSIYHLKSMLKTKLIMLGKKFEYVDIVEIVGHPTGYLTAVVVFRQFTDEGQKTRMFQTSAVKSTERASALTFAPFTVMDADGNTMVCSGSTSHDRIENYELKSYDEVIHEFKTFL